MTADPKRAQEDSELFDWLTGVCHPTMGAGDFLRHLAEASLRADWENYPILRPALLKIAAKYPEYREAERERRLKEE